MKNKRLFRSFFVLLAALVLLGGFSVTAYAGGGDYYDEVNDEPIPTETAAPQPLTPEGNMHLVDDIEGEAAEDKQFIVVKSKGGNYFYIIIDNAAQGENTVHFLNQVDEADLLSIIDEYKLPRQPEVTPEPTPEPTPQPEPKQPTEEKSGMGGLVVFLIVALLGGGAFYYFKVMKPKQSAKGNTDLDDFDFDEYEDDEDEQPEADAEEQEDEE